MDWKLDTIIDILKEIKNHTDHEDHEDEEGDYTNDYLILGVIYSNPIILPEIRQYTNLNGTIYRIHF